LHPCRVAMAPSSTPLAAFFSTPGRIGPVNGVRAGFSRSLCLSKTSPRFVSWVLTLGGAFVGHWRTLHLVFWVLTTACSNTPDDQRARNLAVAVVAAPAGGAYLLPSQELVQLRASTRRRLKNQAPPWSRVAVGQGKGVDPLVPRARAPPALRATRLHPLPLLSGGARGGAPRRRGGAVGSARPHERAAALDGTASQVGESPTAVACLQDGWISSPTKNGLVR